MENDLVDRPSPILDSRPTPPRSSEALLADLSPDERTSGPRLAAVFAGLVTLFLLSSLLWLVLTSSDDDSGDFSSVPAIETTLPPTPEGTRQSAQADLQALEVEADTTETGRSSTEPRGRDEVSDSGQAPSDPSSPNQPDSDTSEQPDNATNDEASEQDGQGTDGEGANSSSGESNTQPPASETSAGTDQATSSTAGGTVTVQTQSLIDDTVLPGVIVRLVSESTGQASTATASRSGFAFVTMAPGCGTLTFQPPEGYEIVAPASGTIRTCSQNRTATEFATFRSAGGTPGGPPTSVGWDDSPSSCDANAERSFGTGFTNPEATAIRVRIVILDFYGSVVDQSEVQTLAPNEQARVELDGISEGEFTVKLINASNNATIEQLSQTFDRC